MNGKYRSIGVKLSDGKYKLSYRRGYYADEEATASVSSSDADPLRPLLARGAPSSTQLLYGVRLLPAPPRPAADPASAGGNTKLTGPLIRYDVDFMIRWTDVNLQSTPEGAHEGKVQVGLIAYDRDGKPLNWVGTTQTMNLNGTIFAAIQHSGIPAHLEIDVPPGQVYLATGVYDWGSKKAGTLEIPLSVSVKAEAANISDGVPTK